MKQNLHSLHKLIRRAREIPIEKPSENAKISPLNNSAVIDHSHGEADINDLHDWSHDSQPDEFTAVKFSVRKASKFSDSMCDSKDIISSQREIQLQVENKFKDPFCPRTIPYDLYLLRNKAIKEIVDEKETIIQ